jgi:hypothetical protein
MDYRDNPPPAAQVVPHCAPIPVPNSKPIDMLGRKTMEVEVLKEALAAAREKKPVWQLPSPSRDASR